MSQPHSFARVAQQQPEVGPYLSLQEGIRHDLAASDQFCASGYLLTWQY
jgi:hypothetical protein